MDWIWNNWFWIMDWLAQEPIEDWGSVIFGYVMFCVVLVTTSPLPLILSKFYRRGWKLVFATLLVISLVVWVATTFRVHEIWNSYQIWYKTPLGRPLS